LKKAWGRPSIHSRSSREGAGIVSARMMPVNDQAPDWLVDEMPPGYQTRAAEIQRLSDELWQMGRFGRLLCSVGDELAEAVRETFNALGCQTEPGPTNEGTTVKLDAHRRLLLHVSAADTVIQKKGSELPVVFQMLHELADDTDRVVLVANPSPSIRPADRPDSVSAEALNLLQRLGANLVTGPTMFALWTLSLKDANRAHAWVERLHEQDGGIFVLSTFGA
jgi:hypothetical protein